MKRFGIICLTAVFLFCSFGCVEAQQDKALPKVEFVKGDDKIDVMIGGELFTSYMFSDKLTKPVLYPVKTPAGIKVNRGFPFEEVAGEAKDHPHHVGIFFTYDEVNGSGFWNNTTSPPQVKHVKVTKMKGGRGTGELSVVMHWEDKNRDVLLIENRKMVFKAEAGQYTVDMSIDLVAGEKKVEFGDTKEGMFAIRTAQWLRESDGTGKYFSSTGDKTAGNIWGKRARWVALEGSKDGNDVGIAILNYPMSENYPTFWHARDYGLFAANPLGQYAFEKSRKVDNASKYALTLEPGEKTHLNFLIMIYDGKRTAEQLDKLFGAYPK